ncbi:hypothetical protein AB1I55_07535 [Enterococcus entomosocium]|uniref:DUF5626 domain-containing protein n=1 Tax=Enterococcus entomosocium TaxID=3034352 RepID=A0ABV3MBV8_9ENTE|nr:hypothetical protein [Enterococcus casseliflavus]
MKKFLIWLLTLGFFTVFSIGANASTITDNSIIEGDIAKVSINDEQYLEFDKNYLNLIESVSTDLNEINNDYPNSDFRTAALIPVRSYTKSITITFSNPNFFKSTKYGEYKYNAWYRGTLYFQSSRKSGSVYIATYTGTLIISNV